VELQVHSALVQLQHRFAQLFEPSGDIAASDWVAACPPFTGPRVDWPAPGVGVVRPRSGWTEFPCRPPAYLYQHLYRPAMYIARPLSFPARPTPPRGRLNGSPTIGWTASRLRPRERVTAQSLLATLGDPPLSAAAAPSCLSQLEIPRSAEPSRRVARQVAAQPILDGTISRSPGVGINDGRSGQPKFHLPSQPGSAGECGGQPPPVGRRIDVRSSALGSSNEGSGREVEIGRSPMATWRTHPGRRQSLAL
jgi:hypothetical protein